MCDLNNNKIKNGLSNAHSYIYKSVMIFDKISKCEEASEEVRDKSNRISSALKIDLEEIKKIEKINNKELILKE